jgi:hypothetical protein
MIHTLYKIGGLITMIIWLNFPVNAQKKLKDCDTDTIYYHFYNDIQMIEIIYNFSPSKQALMNYEHHLATMSSIPSPPSSYRFSVYVFRTSKGEIISVFNQRKEKMKADDFIQVASLNGKTVNHQHEPKRKVISTLYNFEKRDHPILFLDDSSLNKKWVREFYTIFHIDTIANKQASKDYTKLTEQEYFYLTQGKKGVVDTLGNLVLNPVYDEIWWRDSGFIMTRDAKISFLSSNSQSILTEYDQYKQISFKLFAVQSNNLWGFVNERGQLITELSYENIQYPAVSEYSSNKLSNHKYISLTKNNKQGLFDTSLKEVLPIEFTTIGISNFKERDYFFVSLDGKMGVFNDELKLIIPIKYEKWIFPSIHKNSFLVKENGKHGVLDFEGNVVLPCEYDLIVQHGKNTYTVHKGNKYGIFDSYMNNIYPIELDGFFEILNKGTQHPYYLIKKEGKLGIYNSDNNAIVAPQYDKITFYPKEGFFIYLDNKVGLLDLDFNKMSTLK